MADNDNNDNNNNVPVGDLIDLNDEIGADASSAASASASASALLGEFSADLADLSLGELLISGDGEDDDDEMGDDSGDALYGGLLLPKAASTPVTASSSSATVADFGLPPTPQTPPRVESLEADDSPSMDVEAPALPPVVVSAPPPQPPAPADGGAAANVDATDGVIVVSNPVRIICKLYFVYSLFKFVFNQFRACLI